MTFDDCFNDSVLFEVSGVEVRVVGIEALKLNKRVSGRLRDLADLEDLERLED